MRKLLIQMHGFPASGKSTYAVMYAQAGRLLADGHSVVFDSPCFWPIIEETTRRIAHESEADWVMIETRCSDELRDSRFATRIRLESNPAARDTGPLRPGTYQPECERIVLDTSRPLATLVAEAAACIRETALLPRPPLPTPASRERGGLSTKVAGR